MQQQYTVCLQKRSPFYILNNSLKTIDFNNFGVQYPEEISHQKIINPPTSPE